MNLVKQLRTWDEMPEYDSDSFHWLDVKTAEAADLIERQAAQIEMMREALSKIEYLESANGCIMSAGDCSSVATEALSTTPDQALEQFAAEQAKNVELRDALNRLQEAGNGEYDNEFYAANSAATKTLSASSDTSALEAMIAKAGEKMREKAEDEFSNPFRDTVFKWDAAIDIIRTLPGVTLEDLK